MYALATRLTAAEPNAYGAVKADGAASAGELRVQRARTPRPLPLNGFLFEDRRGYCQQFSGAMALMLRMAGIPARVAAGFSPGSYNKDTREYRVRDLDAHSWVEVWFTGIGWVPFDPTPAASPAESQSTAAAASAAGVGAGEVRAGVWPPSAPRKRSRRAPGRAPAGCRRPSSPFSLALLAGSGLLMAQRRRRLHALGPDELADVQLSELRRTLLRLGWDLPVPPPRCWPWSGASGASPGPRPGAYAGALRATRYDPREPAGPPLRERRDVRAS